jgi:hypothetical protein
MITRTRLAGVLCAVAISGCDDNTDYGWDLGDAPWDAPGDAVDSLLDSPDVPGDVPADPPVDGPADTSPDTTPGECNLLCGAAAVPEAGCGRNSFAPPGCAGGSFSYRWGVRLVADAGKSVPVAEDLDGDGDLDIAVNPRISNSCHVFPGNGDGTFASAVLLPPGGMFAGGWGIDVGDFTNDGRLDVAVGDHVAGAVAWTNGGGLSFSLATTGLPSDTLQGAGLMDLDGDGNLDAVFGADQFSSGFVVRHGNGSGSWTDRGVSGIPALGAGSSANNGWINSSDIEGDGDVDVIAFGQVGGGLAALVFFNGGDGVSFTSTTIGGGGGGSVGNPVQGAIGDVDCDGDLDIALGGRIYLGSGTSWSPGATADAAKVSTLGDLNGDGYLDLVTQQDASGVRAYLNDGSGTSFALEDMGLPGASWSSPAASGSMDSAYGLDLADVTGDGVLDLVRTFSVSSGMSTVAVMEVWTR